MNLVLMTSAIRSPSNSKTTHSELKNFGYHLTSMLYFLSLIYFFCLPTEYTSKNRKNNILQKTTPKKTDHRKATE